MDLPESTAHLNLKAKIGLIAGHLGILSTSSFHVFRRNYSRAPSKIKRNLELNIRLMVPEDIPKISQKLEINFQENFNRGHGGMVATIGDRLIHWSLFGHTLLYQEMIDGKIRLSSDSAYIFNMYTDPEYRGQAISAQVLDAICSHLYLKGLTKFYVFIIKNNWSSIKSVSKVSFHEIGSVTYFRLFNFRFFKITGAEKVALRKMLNVCAPTEICYVF